MQAQGSRCNFQGIPQVILTQKRIATMQVLLLALLSGLCSSLPTNTAPGPYILDLTGGAAQPGQVVGQVDGLTGNMIQPGVLLDPVPPSQPRVELPTIQPPILPPLPTLPPIDMTIVESRTLPEIVHIPVPNSAVQPVDQRVNVLPEIVVDPSLSIGGGSPPPPSVSAIDWTCEGYRPHPTNSTMYQVFYNQQWADRSCYGILEWSQALCSCLVPEPTGVVDVNCPNNRAHPTDPKLYQIKHLGVWLTEPKSCGIHQLWNQTGCRCDWDPLGPGGVFDTPTGGICDLMFNASFTNSLKDDANFNSIGRDPWFNVKVENGTARLDKGRMPVWAFASNDFKRDFQVQMNYKLDNIPANANLYTTLVSNDCEYDKASVGVSYRPADQSYKVFFRDTYLNSTLQCRSPTITPYAFQSMSLEYQSSQLSLKVNGVSCLESNNFGGDVAISQCPFYFGGDGRQQYMTGNLDDVVVRRYCVVPA